MIHPETSGWRLTGRAVWAVGGAGVTSLADALRAAGAQVTVSPPPRAAAWAEDASQAIGGLDGLILVLEDPADDPGAAARPRADRETAVTDRLGAIFCTVRAAARRMVAAGGAIVLVAPDEWGEGLVPEPRSGALQTLMRSLAIALGSASITVNLVSVRSPASRSSGDGPGAPVAGPVCYLLARDTSYLTGQVLHVDAAS